MFLSRKANEMTTTFSLLYRKQALKSNRSNSLIAPITFMLIICYSTVTDLARFLG